jgi:hypothetical protein
MPEGIISTHEVRFTPDRRSVEVIATLDAGEVVPGMFVYIPLNGLLDLTVKVSEVFREAGNRVRLLLDCGEEAAGAELVKAFNFEDETLWVLETGDD